MEGGEEPSESVVIANKLDTIGTAVPMEGRTHPEKQVVVTTRVTTGIRTVATTTLLGHLVPVKKNLMMTMISCKCEYNREGIIVV